MPVKFWQTISRFWFFLSYLITTVCTYLFILSFKLVNLKRIWAVKFISDFIFNDLFTRPESKSLHLIFCRQWSLCRDVKNQFTAPDFNMLELWQIITMHKKITVHNRAWFCICEGKEEWSGGTVDWPFMLRTLNVM